MRRFVVCMIMFMIVPDDGKAAIIRDTAGGGTLIDGAVMNDGGVDSWGNPGITIKGAPAGKLGEWRFRVAGLHTGDFPIPFVDPAKFDPFAFSLFVGTEAQYTANPRGLDLAGSPVYTEADGLAVTVSGVFPDFFLVADLEPLAIDVSGDFVLALKSLSSSPADGTIVLAAYDGAISPVEDLFAGNFTEFESSYSPGKIVTDHGFVFSQFAIVGEVIVPEPGSIVLSLIAVIFLSVGLRARLKGPIGGS